MLGRAHRLPPARPLAAPRPSLLLRRPPAHAADIVRPRAQPPGALRHDRARPRRLPRLLHLRPPAPHGARPHSRTRSGPLGPWVPSAPSRLQGGPNLKPFSPLGAHTSNSAPLYLDLKRTPSPRGTLASGGPGSPESQEPRRASAHTPRPAPQAGTSRRTRGRRPTLAHRGTPSRPEPGAPN